MVIKQSIMIRAILIAIVFAILCFSFIIFNYSGYISNRLTYNLNRNLEVDWGKNHPKFKKNNLNVDFAEMLISWDLLSIVLPTYKGANILNTFSNINSYGCILNIRPSLKIIIDINCNEIDVSIKQNKWMKYRDLNISSSFFFEDRVFSDLYSKQVFFEVKIMTDKLYINNTNLGEYMINYIFKDEDNLLINVNKNDITVKKQDEGLSIKTPNSNFFILNHNFFHQSKFLYGYHN